MATAGPNQLLLTSGDRANLTGKRTPVALKPRSLARNVETPVPDWPDVR